MTTVVDELILKFSLDPKQFNQSQQQVINQLKKLEGTTKEVGSKVEDSAQRMVDGFSRVTKEVLGLGAAFLGVSGMKDLVVGTVQAAANLDLMTRAFNLSAEAMNRWQNVGRQFNVSGDTTMAAITNIASLQQQLRQGKVTPDALGQSSMFALAGVTTNELATMDTFELLHKVAGGARKDPKNMAGYLAGTPFAPLMPTLMQNDLNSRLGDALTQTKEMADNAERVRKAFVEAVEAVEKLTNKTILSSESMLQYMNIINAVKAATEGDLTVARYLLSQYAGQGGKLEGNTIDAIKKGIYIPAMRDWFFGPGDPMAGAQNRVRSAFGDSAPQHGGFRDVPSPFDMADNYYGMVYPKVKQGFEAPPWVDMYMKNTPLGHSGSHPGFGNFGSVMNDNSHAISIAHMDLNFPDGSSGQQQARSFISSVTAQSATGYR